MGIRQTDGGRWKARVRAAGSDVVKTFENEADAAVWHARAKEAALNGRPLPEPSSLASDGVTGSTLRAVLELADKYLWPTQVDGQRSMRRAIKVARLIGLDLPLKGLNSDHLSDAAFALRDWEVSTETKRKTFNAFRGALTNFRRYSKEALPELVWPHFKRSDSKPRSLSLQEVRAMMLRFEEPYRFLFRFLLDTGLQPKEWSDLMLSDVSVPTDDDGVPSGYFLRVRQKEKGEGAPTRVVPLTSDAVTGLLGYLDYLKAQPNRAKTTHLFDIDPDHYRAEWNRVKKAAGLTDPRITPYTTRHTFGVRLAKVGVNPLVIAKLMGHTSLDTVQHYVSLSNEDINEAIKTLEKTYG